MTSSATRAARPASGSRRSPPPTSRSRTLGPRSRSPRQRGGQPPLDPKSNEPNFQTELTHRFEADADAQARLATTGCLHHGKDEGFGPVFSPGGHGPMWDLAEDPISVKLLETMYRAGKPIALVCHAPGVLRHVEA